MVTEKTVHGRGGAHILWTGEQQCHDENGVPRRCVDLGLVTETEMYPPWEESRFELVGDMLVRDNQTGLIWTREACPAEFPLSWSESLQAIREMNTSGMYGRDDFRLPNRREFRSLIDHSRSEPALPPGHPFGRVDLGWYWTSTTSALAPPYAWYLQLAGGRMFYGRKDELHWYWPVCGETRLLPTTGQRLCYDRQGREIPCDGSGGDGELRSGEEWPVPRFQKHLSGVLDRLTGLVWKEQPGLSDGAMSWQEAIIAVGEFAKRTGQPWRMPTINELESLTDCSVHSPALAEGSFYGVHEAYWSATTSGYERDWAYVMYLHKGAVGVGYKKGREFQVWPVMVEADRKMNV